MSSKSSLQRFALGVATFLSGVVVLTLVSQCGNTSAKTNELVDFGAVPNFELTERSGQPLTLADLKGKVWVCYFFFTTCTGICPPMNQSMAKVQERTKDLKGLRMLGISCDPERDTPEKLRAFADSYKAEKDRWLFVTGPFETVQNIATTAMKLGLEKASPEQVEKGTAERVMHSSKFVLVDQKGRVRGYFNGLEEKGVEQLEVAIRRLHASAEQG